MQTAVLTKRESQIMNIIWNSAAPVSAHDILLCAPELSRNTIQIVLKKLQGAGFIEVAGLSYNKNALTRTFSPVISQSEYLADSLSDSTLSSLTRIFITQTASAKDLDGLDDLIARRRLELES